MDSIIISELEVAYHVGVGEPERAAAQRLLVSVEMAHDFRAAAELDDLTHTIDYYAVCQRLLSFGEGRSWRLIETLALDIAAMVQKEFHATSVTVEVKKFIIPATRHVAVRVTRPLGPA